MRADFRTFKFTDGGTSCSRNTLGSILTNNMTIEPFGELSYNSRDNEWFGRVKNISPDNEIELSILVTSKDEDISHKTQILKNFAKNYQTTMGDLYEFIYKKLNIAHPLKTIDQIKQMYSFAAISLQLDNKSIWVTFEPAIEIETIFDHFIRLTLLDGRIVWSNLT